MPSSPINQPLSSNTVPSTRNAPSVALASFVADRLLIVDDSTQICSMLVTNIIKACNVSRRPYQIIQSGPLGLVEVDSVSSESGGTPLIIYTANCPRNALPILRLSGLDHLIIISDIMMPSDTEVGLLGMLQELSNHHLSVSLIFASSERQNRYYVEDVLQSGKAHFMEKGSQAWGELPFRLVEDTKQFQYKVIVRGDFDRGRAPIEHTSSSAKASSERPSAPVPRTTQLQPALATAGTKTSLWQRLAFWKARR
ncbi:MAG: hypothetical protein WCS37_05290 [Chloroflexota bacterium]|nr:hypothetical protein [Chloroflexota bacterium]